MPSTVPKAIMLLVLLVALKDDAAPGAQQSVENGATTTCKVTLRLADQLSHCSVPHGTLPPTINCSASTHPTLLTVLARKINRGLGCSGLAYPLPV